MRDYNQGEGKEDGEVGSREIDFSGMGWLWFIGVSVEMG